MADPNTRQGKRTPVTLKTKFKSETLEQFIERYAVDVSQGGIFIRTKEPLAVGTQMKFEFQLRDASPLIAGEGTVVWTRENDPSRPAIAPGMGVRFDRLADGSQAVLERILAEKAKQAPNRSGPNESTTKPPMFTDTPTRVAPAPVQEALGVRPPRARSDSEQTPLPPPRPFHSDADEFDEKAFEEATKVRSLEELAAQTAGGLASLTGLDPASDPANDPAASDHDAASDDAPTNTAIPVPADELAARRQNGRADSTLSEPPEAAPADAGAAAAATATRAAGVERESAPGLPEPPSRPGDSTPPVNKRDEAAGTKLGVEPAKAATRSKSDSAAPRAVTAESSLPAAPQRPSAAPIIILLLVLVAGAAGAVWWFVLREQVAEDVAQQDQVGTDSAVAIVPEGSGSAAATGSDGSAAAMMQQDGSGSDGSDGSAAVEPPAPAIVDTVIAASAKGATIEVVGTDQKGAAPFTAKLEKDKAYTAKVSAPGYAPTKLEIKGGQDKATAKLAPKPRILMVTTNPPGAAIYVDNVDSLEISPAEVRLTAAQAARSRVRISLRRPGYRPVDRVLDARKFQESDSKMTASLTAKLTLQARPDAGTGSGSATHTGSGSATTPSGSGSGSATTPSGGGTGSATTPAGGGTGTTTPPAGAGAETKPPAATPATGAGSTPSASRSPASTATPTASADEPEPTWAK